MDLKERTAWRNYSANPCPETAMAWAQVHARTIGIPNELPLKEVTGLGGRARNLLVERGITTWEQLCKTYLSQLKGIRGMGPAHRNNVIGVLGANDVKLKKNPTSQEEWAALFKSIPQELHHSYSWGFITRLHNQNNLPSPPYWR